MIAFFERVQRHCPRGIRDRVVGPAGCHQRDRDLVQPSLDRGRDAVPFHQQPRLELRAGRQFHTFKELAAEGQKERRVGHLDVLAGEQLNVDDRLVAERRNDGITGENIRYGERPA